MQLNLRLQSLRKNHNNSKILLHVFRGTEERGPSISPPPSDNTPKFSEFSESTESQQEVVGVAGVQGQCQNPGRMARSSTL